MAWRILEPTTTVSDGSSFLKTDSGDESLSFVSEKPIVMSTKEFESPSWNRYGASNLKNEQSKPSTEDSNLMSLQFDTTTDSGILKDKSDDNSNIFNHGDNQTYFDIDKREEFLDLDFENETEFSSDKTTKMPEESKVKDEGKQNYYDGTGNLGK